MLTLTPVTARPKRVYTLSDAKGIMVITCIDDREAISQAKEMFDDDELIVWEDDRIVTTLRSANKH
jgi:hypothetical protein